MIEHKIVGVLDKLFGEEEFEDCFLVEIKESLDGRKVEVFVESDTTLTLGRCQRISRRIEKQIEENRWLPEAYLLEVSSPGVGNPLVLKRQYVKNIGRLIEIKTADGETKKGILTEVKEEEVVVVEAAHGKGKKKVEERIYRINFDQIKNAKIKVSF